MCLLCVHLRHRVIFPFLEKAYGRLKLVSIQDPECPKGGAFLMENYATIRPSK